MATKKITFTVSPSSDISNFWIRVGERDVPLDAENKGSIILKINVEHYLIWWMAGEPKASIKIIGKDGLKTVVEIKKSKIPSIRTDGAGTKSFKL